MKKKYCKHVLHVFGVVCALAMIMSGSVFYKIMMFAFMIYASKKIILLKHTSDN